MMRCHLTFILLVLFVQFALSSAVRYNYGGGQVYTSLFITIPKAIPSIAKPPPALTPVSSSTAYAAKPSNAAHVVTNKNDIGSPSLPAAGPQSLHSAAVSKSLPLSPASHSSESSHINISLGPSSSSLPPPSSSPSPSNSSKTSAPISDASVKAISKSRLLAAIITSILLVTGAVGGTVLAVCRRRHRRAQHMMVRGSIWSFVRVVGGLKGISPRARNTTYEGGADWNRSDAHLRATQDSAIAESDPDAGIHDLESVIASTVHSSEREPSDVGHDLALGFHSESSTHDEPALADSRPGTLFQHFTLPPLPEYSP
ncbi:hypothetical protein B0H16DRAFT_1693645 [Mycena metata]|uniref:Mid2 domain-containing protein n=1 Tax=Mycena metata TaxID=1033252 RepID=A0AAD7II07_9AGAR|nr:hypothetical protein B0H16DRAFT_1693645 [Mycena metata]